MSASSPTLGRIPRASSIEPADLPIGIQLTAVEGPMAAGGRSAGGTRGVVGSNLARPVGGPGATSRPRSDCAGAGRGGARPGRQGTAPQVQDGVRKAAAALDHGYVIDEAEPPSIAFAAQTLLDMLNTADIRATWQNTSSLLPPDTQRFLRRSSTPWPVIQTRW